MSAVARVEAPPPDGDAGRTRGFSLLATLAAGAIVLGLFDFFSSRSSVAKRGILSQRPPVYGLFQPSFWRIGAVALALAAAAGAGAYLVSRSRRVRPATFLALGVAFVLAFAAAVAVVNGDAKAYTDPLERVRPADYEQDVAHARHIGLRRFVREHPRLVPAFRSVHSQTHPPGPVVFFALLQKIFPKHLVPRALVVAFLAALVLVPTWFLARGLSGGRAALFAVLLIAVAPSPVIFVFTSMDAVYATMLASIAALFVWAIRRGGWLLPVAAGAAAAAGSFFTYAAGFVVAAMVVYGFATRPPRKAFRILAIAGASTLATLGVMRLGMGFDLLASYRASYTDVPVTVRSYPYWVFGNPMVWLTFAGLPIAALAMREFLTRRPAYLLGLFLPLLAANLTTIFPGETERIGMFAYPFIAVAAGTALARWEDSRGGRRPGAVAVLVVVAALQTVLLEALFYTYW